MKKRIRLTESDLHRVIAESVIDLLGLQYLDSDRANEILAMAKSAGSALILLNRKANEFQLYELARDSAKIYETMKDMIDRIVASMPSFNIKL